MGFAPHRPLRAYARHVHGLILAANLANGARIRQQVRRFVRTRLDPLLGAVGLQRTRRRAAQVSDYLDLQQTLEGARRSGLSVGDYVDTTYNRPGVTQETIDKLAELGVFGERIERVCEIGPGSGRYLEKTLAACRPSHYEIYETAEAWGDWLHREYPVVAQPTDGSTLAATPLDSIDLVQAHKVFPAIPSMKTVRYFREMDRVTRAGGWAVFDVLTEDCLDAPTLDSWLAASVDYDTYPAFMPKRFVTDLFTQRGFSLQGSFIVPMVPGETECMVFRRDRPRSASSGAPE
jgi:hypothetical protein